MSDVNFEENASTPCKSQHKWSGRILTESDSELNETPCDCGKFIVRFEGCGCGGAKPQPKYYENINYIPNN
jgi:hypothetical protein